MNNKKILNKKRERENFEDKQNDITENQNFKNFNEDCNFNIEFKSNPKNIHFFKNLINEKPAKNMSYYNSFIVFNSIHNILYLIYSDINNCAMISYNINDNKKMNSIKNAHHYYITEFRHHQDNSNKRDLIISLSAWICDIRVWDVNNFDCLFNIEEPDEIDNKPNDTFLYSSCFLCENSNIYIVFGKQNIVYDENERPIKVFNLSGKLIKDMNESGEGTNYIDNYYDEKSSKHFIISKYKMNDDDYIKSFDFKENKLFHKYRENNNNYDDNSDFENSDYTDDIIINDKGKIVELFDFSYDNYIRIWNFHSGELLRKININIHSNIYSFFLWNKKYLIMGCNDCTIKILDIEKETIIKELLVHLDVVKTIRKLIHPKYGECLLTQGKTEENIKLWITN